MTPRTARRAATATKIIKLPLNTSYQNGQDTSTRSRRRRSGIRKVEAMRAACQTNGPAAMSGPMIQAMTGDHR